MITFSKIKAPLTVKDVTAKRSGYHLNPEPIPLHQPGASIMKNVRKTFRTDGNRWILAGSAPNDGRLPGTVTMPTFGFVDDFEVRVESLNPDPETWKVFSRSQSRIDCGAPGNIARTTRSFYQRLRELQSED